MENLIACFRGSPGRLLDLNNCLARLLLRCFSAGVHTVAAPIVMDFASPLEYEIN